MTLLKPLKININAFHIVFASIILEFILFYLYYIPETKLLIGDEKRYFRYAKAVVSGDEWYFSPTWPHIILSFFLKATKETLVAFQIYQYVLLVFSGFIVKNIVFRETRNINSSNLSLAIMLLYPTWLAYSLFLWPEVVHVFLFISVIWIFNYKYDNNIWLFIGFSFIGLMLLFKGLIVLFIPVFLIPLYINLPVKQAILKIVVGVFVTILVISPVSIEAHKMSGSWMPSNSSMYNLWLGLRDYTRTLTISTQAIKKKKMRGDYHKYLLSAETYQERNALLVDKIKKYISEKGIVSILTNQLSKQYFRLFDYKSKFYMQFQKGYKPEKKGFIIDLILVYNNVVYGATLLALFLGSILYFKKSIITVQFTLFTLYIFGLFLLLHTIARFRIPLVPLSAFYIGFLYNYFPNLHNKTNSKKYWIKVMSLIFLLLIVLFVMFAGVYLDKVMPIN